MIYLATNSANGKRYVGQTGKPLECRRAAHEKNARSGRLSRFYSALRKHGAAAFTWWVLDSVADKIGMDQREICLIAQFQSNDPQFGYNLTAGGDGMANPSDETRRKMSESHKGQSHNRGLKRSEAVCQAMRERMMGTAYHRGYKHSPEAKAKMRAAKLGKKIGSRSAAVKATMRKSARLRELARFIKTVAWG